MTDRERKALADALTEWRWFCAVRYWDQTLGQMLAQQKTHYYELNQRGRAQ